MGTQLLQKKGTAPTQFLAHVYCGQTDGWIKMPLDTKVNLGPGDVVLDWVAAPPKRAQPPVFGSCLLWPDGWMDEDATWYTEVDLGLSHIVLDGDLAPLPKRGPSSRLATVKCTKNWGLCPF